MKTVKLHNEIYSQNAVLAAISAYKELCSVELSMTNHYYVCTFENCKYEENLTAAEFENYTIDFMNCSQI